MQFNKQFALTLTMLASLAALFTAPASAAPEPKGKTTYTEDEFLRTFSGKSRKVIIEKLGTPARKEQSIKPANADKMVSAIGMPVSSSKNNKVLNIEMWYYKNLVKYDDKRTYRETELTIVDDKCVNIGFFNTK